MVIDMKILLYDTGDVRGELNEPIGIELLAVHVLNELEVSVDIKWFNFDGYDFNPLEYDVIGVSIHINGLGVFEHIYKLCCKCEFHGLIVAGNSVATFAYQQLLEKYPNIVCSIGEGEHTFKNIIQSYASGHFEPVYIPNLAYLEHGNLVVTKRKQFDLQGYLPPLRVFNQQIRANGGIARIEASRGCAWNKCNFCGAAHKYNLTGWRPIDLEVILDQLVELSQAKLTTVYFCDEDFIGNDSGRFAVLVERIRQKMETGEISFDMKFFISVKPTDLIDQANIKIIEQFIKCGLKDLFVGLESGCDSQLRRYNKCTNVRINSIVTNIIKELSQKGLTIDIGFIFFDFSMVPQEVEENLNFIEANQLYLLASSLFKPIRIQPFTKTFVETTEVYGNQFIIDDLMYDYHFIDSTVEKIYTTYSRLRLETVAHVLQSAYRRDMSSEKNREQSAKNLLSLRYMQFLAMKAIVAHYIHNTLNEIQLRNRLKEIVRDANNLPKI